MYAVGRIGSYITRGVCTVAGPFHPFGGAVDIIVVEQPDGSFKSSPWYVRFGKFQGVLKAREKVVKICINDVEVDFHMYLNQRGEAFFLRDEEGKSGESLLYSSSSSDDADELSPESMMPWKSKSCNYDSAHSGSSVQIDSSSGKIIARTNSRRSRVLGRMFGGKKAHIIDQEDIGAEVLRNDSLERAEIAANLLELKWSTNLATSKKRKDGTSPLSISGMPDTIADQNDDRQNRTGSPTGLCKEEVGNISRVKAENLESPIEDDDKEMLTLGGMKEISETALLGEGVIEEKCEVVSELLKKSNEFNSHIDVENDNVEHNTSEANKDESHSTNVVEECPTNKFDEEQASDKEEDRLTSEFNAPNLRDHDIPEAFTGKKFDGQTFDEMDDVHIATEGFGVSEVESGHDRVPSSFHVEISESLVVGLDGSSERTDETLYVTNGGAEELQIAADSLQLTSDLHPEATGICTDRNFKVETESIESTDNYSQNEEMNLKVPLAVSESFTHSVGVAPTSGLFKDVESDNYTISNSINSSCPIQLENTCQSKAASSLGSENLEEDQFLFSDLDESKLNESFVCLDEGKDPLKMGEDSEDSINAFNTDVESDSFPFQKNELSDLGDLSNDSKVTSGAIDVPTVPSVSDGQIEWLAESVPVIRSLSDNLDSDNLYPLCHSLDSPSDTWEWTLHSRNNSYPSNVETGNGIESEEKLSNLEDIYDSIDKNEPATGDAKKTVASSGKSWGIWPFRRSRSRKIVQPVLIDTKISNVESASESSSVANEEKVLLKSKVNKKVKAMTPTSEQVASLNLQEGRNVVTFTFSTAVWGKQKVDASIYLWKWDDRIVISDVDGTITRSDVLGQFMPMVGVDWSQTGVAHLFTGIKENGYQFLFLSARSISQAYITRQFLVNLKQDGKGLPDGPIVISPDGLFPSLFREVIRRAPHEFKIACLEDIKALFPPDCNPFYAGFGNRDTDELSYLKVGIPRGKIFTINPKGEVAVNRQVDTRSYTSLHSLVHDMFPPSTTTSEQEDYNSWNFWRLPPPLIDI